MLSFLLVGLGLLLDGTIDTSDCERVRAAFPTQPVNTWSSLAYVLTGAWVWLRFVRPAPDPTASGARWVAIGLVVTGLGSVAYHGFGGGAARWLHDWSFLALLLLVVVQDWPPAPAWSGTRPRAALTGAVVVGLAAVVPLATNATLVVLIALLAWAQRGSWPARSRVARAQLAVVAALGVLAVATYLASRTGSPWCDPDAVPQGHGLWHVLSAITFGLWARATYPLAQASAEATAPGPTVS